MSNLITDIDLVNHYLNKGLKTNQNPEQLNKHNLFLWAIEDDLRCKFNQKTRSTKTHILILPKPDNIESVEYKDNKSTNTFFAYTSFIKPKLYAYTSQKDENTEIIEIEFLNSFRVSNGIYVIRNDLLLPLESESKITKDLESKITGFQIKKFNQLI